MNEVTTQKTGQGTTALILLIILATSLFIQDAINSRQAILFIIGIGLGFTLLHALFGFTGGWRNFIRSRNSNGVRAQLILLLLTSIVFFPLLGDLFPELKVQGALAPIGFSVLVGAFLFGIGMQLGGGCGSGTLFTVGQGQVDMIATLIFFIIGSTFASSHLDWWWQTGDIGTVSIVKSFGWLPALALQIAVLAVLYVVVSKIDRARNRSLTPLTIKPEKHDLITTLIHGRWPILWGAIGLFVFGTLTLLVAGHPWSITYAFSLWGTKIWSALGGDISTWSYWKLDYPATSLDHSVLTDVTSVMNFGLLLGAALAATLAARFAPATQFSKNKIIAIVAGGLLLGYGARLAFGCNIGALLAGISSGSLHGWLWLVAAFIGNIIGVHARIVLRLDKPIS